jgi:hypothetical protein
MFAGKCASAWFDRRWNHCDDGDLQFGFYGSTVFGGTSQIGPGITSMTFSSETLLVRIPPDITAPEIVATVNGTLGDNGWYTSDVTVSWSVTDPESEVVSQTDCVESTVNANTPGIKFRCSATSGGGSGSDSVIIKRDATIPTVVYSGNAGSYTIDQQIAIDCSSADDMSGIASDTCVDISGPAYALSLGANNYSASAVDSAGNVGNGQTSFNVVVTFASLCNLTSSFVSDSGVGGSLCAKLNAGALAFSHGNANAVQNQLSAYQNELAAQSGKSLSAEQAAVLSALANALK